ncbi:hypothetical protein PUN28_011687 [Cardiocondyla obscurior]|uniref:Uncharacterized protein n=1 Tax=Cardiocondyla obscurior TaxID=286306 RepID=A0AAW2FIS4_9HYME
MSRALCRLNGKLNCNVSTARGASNGAGEAAYLIRNKYSLHSERSLSLYHTDIYGEIHF